MDKPIPEAMELLRAFQSQFGARRPDEDEDDAETWDRIDSVCKALTAAQQQGQAAPPSAPVGVEGLLADLETIWHSVSDDKETNAAYQRLKSALAQQTAAGAVDVRIIARDIHYAIMDDGLAPLSNADNHKVREAILLGLQAVLAAEGVQAEPKSEAQLTYKGVPIGPMQTFADIERQASAPAGVEGLIEAAKAAESMLRTVHECASHECDDCREYACIHAKHLRDALAQPPADPRAAAEQAIAEALRRERMAPDDYKPMPDRPVPLENDE